MYKNHQNSSDFGRRGLRLPYHPIDYYRSQRKFISGWKGNIVIQYLCDQHLTRIYRGILDDHFTCDEKQVLEPLALIMNKNIVETKEDWSIHKWWWLPLTKACPLLCGWKFYRRNFSKGRRSYNMVMLSIAAGFIVQGPAIKDNEFFPLSMKMARNLSKIG